MAAVFFWPAAHCWLVPLTARAQSQATDNGSQLSLLQQRYMGMRCRPSFSPNSEPWFPELFLLAGGGWITRPGVCIWPTLPPLHHLHIENYEQNSARNGYTESYVLLQPRVSPVLEFLFEEEKEEEEESNTETDKQIITEQR